MSTSTDTQEPTILDLCQLLNDSLSKIRLPGPSSQAKNVSVPIPAFQELTRLTQSILQLAAGTNLPTIDSSLKLIVQLLQNPPSGRANTPAKATETEPTPTTPKISKTSNCDPAIPPVTPSKTKTKTSLKSLEIVLVQKNRTKQALTGKTSRQLVAAINDAIAATGDESILGYWTPGQYDEETGTQHGSWCRFTARAAAYLPSGDIVATFWSQAERDRLLKDSNLWIPHLSKDLKTSITTFDVVVHGLPTDRDLTNINSTATKDFIEENALDAETILHITPLKSRTTPAKPFGSYIFHFKTPTAANEWLELDMLTYENRPVSKEKTIQKPPQCFRCSKYGHIAAHCKQKAPVCGHCAGPHHTRTCTCRAQTPCSDRSTCPHITPKCAACGGPHRATDRNCPERIAQYEAAEVSHLTSGPLYSI